NYHRGLVQYRLGDLGAAEESFKRAVRLQRDYIEAHNLLAQVYYQQGRLEEAEEVKATVQQILAGKR
ncbi:MAG: tetratricopeptide repeat protein, partial [Acidobacteriota bacterium]|nr:tetratricopeptide repeat protein [Acidobacteriota bacterium]